MSLFRRIFTIAAEKRIIIRNFTSGKCVSTQQAPAFGKDNIKEKQDENSEKSFSELAEYRFVYPEFLPDPSFKIRHRIREKLERMDMLRRRAVIEIPEFYVGSIMAVTTSDPYAPGKENKFVGICIARTFCGLRATFTLRNVVDHQGLELLYDLYNPTILSIEVLRLEKRLDDHLYYLRDAPLHYSTFPFDMEAEFRVEGEPVPVNPLKVKLNPPPWHIKWEQRNLKGVEEIDLSQLEQKRRLNLRKQQKPWEKYDLMLEYRKCIPEEDQVDIWEDLDKHKKHHPVKQQAWKRSLQKAKPRRSIL